LDHHVLVRGVDPALSGAEADGRDAVLEQPVGIEAAVGDAQRGLEAEGAHALTRELDHRRVLRQAERVVGDVALEIDLRRPAVAAAQAPSGTRERTRVGGDDLLPEALVVAPRLALEPQEVDDDVGAAADAPAVAAGERAHVRRAGALRPLDLPEPSP